MGIFCSEKSVMLSAFVAIGCVLFLFLWVTNDAIQLNLIPGKKLLNKRQRERERENKEASKKSHTSESNSHIWQNI